MITEPMLAGTVKDISKLRYPLIATPKLDGIRALMIDGKLVSRKFKPIPNHYVRNVLEKLLETGMDGELITGNFQDTASEIMSHGGEPKFTFYIFDWVAGSLDESYERRVARYQDWWTEEANKACRPFPIEPLFGELITDELELLKYEQDCIEEQYEGIMLRSPSSPYKCGRSTFKEHYLLKLKRFEDAEAFVVDFVEQMHNANEREEDAFGRAKRSHAKAGKVGTKMLGAFVVCDVKTGVRFEIGTGFTREERIKYWENMPSYEGKVLTYKYQPHGVKDKPRAPVFKGWRED